MDAEMDLTRLASADFEPYDMSHTQARPELDWADMEVALPLISPPAMWCVEELPKRAP